MFGRLRFLLNGAMAAGVHTGGGMDRIGRKNRAEAIPVRRAGPVTMGPKGRGMAQMAGLAPEAMPVSATPSRPLGLALAHVGTLPATSPGSQAAAFALSGSKPD